MSSFCLNVPFLLGPFLPNFDLVFGLWYSAEDLNFIEILHRQMCKICGASGHTQTSVSKYFFRTNKTYIAYIHMTMKKCYFLLRGKSWCSHLFYTVLWLRQNFCRNYIASTQIVWWVISSFVFFPIFVVLILVYFHKIWLIDLYFRLHVLLLF